MWISKQEYDESGPSIGTWRERLPVGTPIQPPVSGSVCCLPYTHYTHSNTHLPSPPPPRHHPRLISSSFSPLSLHMFALQSTASASKRTNAHAGGKRKSERELQHKCNAKLEPQQVTAYRVPRTRSSSGGTCHTQIGVSRCRGFSASRGRTD
jgi:hypothetical protein